MLEEFASLRSKQIELIESASPEIRRRNADHPEYREYGFGIIIRHVLLHDSFHMYRMEELWLTRDEYLT